MKKLSFAYFSKSFWEKLNTFRKREKPQGVTAPPPTAKQTINTRKIHQALDELKQTVARRHGIPEKEREKIKRTKSTVEAKLDSLNLESSLFKAFDWPSWKIAQANRKQDMQMHQREHLSLYHAIVDNNVRTVEDLTGMEEKTRAEILSRVIDKGTFLRLCRIAWATQHDAPAKAGIHRTQYIHNRMQKVFQ
jgi:hypothetical protein